MDYEAEKHISKIFQRPIPYNKDIVGINFIINNNNIYPPGKLTELFANYLIEKNLFKDKFVADISRGCFALGIIAAVKGAKKVIGTEVNHYAVEQAKEHIIKNNLQDKAQVIEGNGVDPLLPKYKHQLDIVVSGFPWSSMKQNEFNKIPKERQMLSQAFYDIDNNFFHNILTNSFSLLKPNGRLFITSSFHVLERTKDLCKKHQVSYRIVKEADIHQDGNTHYIVQLSKN